MRVFRIWSQKCRWLVVNEKDRFSSELKLQYEGESVLDLWNNFSFYIGNPKAKNTDFYNYGDLLVFNQKAYDLLNPILESIGEYLPCCIEGVDNMHMFNVLKNSMCVNEEESHYTAYLPTGISEEKKGIANFKEFPNNKITLRKLFIKASAIRSLVFMIKDHNSNLDGPYCTDGFFPPEDEFYKIYLKNKLTGLNFDEELLSTY